jgi:hypothetical protein
VRTAVKGGEGDAHHAGNRIRERGLDAERDRILRP